MPYPVPQTIEKPYIRESHPSDVEMGSLKFILGKDWEYVSAIAQRLASIIKETVKRPADLVEHYGGEDFAVVLHHNDAVSGICFAQETCIKIRSIKIAPTGSICSQWITFSLGMATLVPTQQLITATLMALANPALDQAKSAGRDRNVRLQQPDSLNAQANLGTVCRSMGEKANVLGLSMRE